jgi:glycosyltransferase involved in cell wall biosynthesis
MRKMSLVIIIPVYNEEKTLASTVEKIKKYFDKKLGKRVPYTILIAGRASKDRTNEIAAQLTKKYTNVEHTKIDYPTKTGRIKKVCMNTSYDVYAFVDADLPVSLDEFYEIVDSVLSRGHDMAIASKYVCGGRQQRTFKRVFASRAYNFLVRMLLPTIRTCDSCAGAKAWNKDVVKHVMPLVKSTNYFFDTELLYYCFANGYRVMEVPVYFKDMRTDSKVNVFKDSVMMGTSLWKFFVHKRVMRR